MTPMVASCDPQKPPRDAQVNEAVARLSILGLQARRRVVTLGVGINVPVASVGVEVHDQRISWSGGYFPSPTGFNYRIEPAGVVLFSGLTEGELFDFVWRLEALLNGQIPAKIDLSLKPHQQWNPHALPAEEETERRRERDQIARFLGEVNGLSCFPLRETGPVMDQIGQESQFETSPLPLSVAAE